MSGVQDLAHSFLEVTKSQDIRAHRQNPRRLQAEGLALLRAQIESRAISELAAIKTPTDLRSVLGKMTAMPLS